MLSLFKKGALKTVVMNKWENMKLKSEKAQNPEPCLDDFWELVEFQYSIIEVGGERGGQQSATIGGQVERQTHFG